MRNMQLNVFKSNQIDEAFLIINKKSEMYEKKIKLRKTNYKNKIYRDAFYKNYVEKLNNK